MFPIKLETEARYTPYRSSLSNRRTRSCITTGKSGVRLCYKQPSQTVSNLQLCHNLVTETPRIQRSIKKDIQFCTPLFLPASCSGLYFLKPTLLPLFIFLILIATISPITISRTITILRAIPVTVAITIFSITIRVSLHIDCINDQIS